MTTPALNDDLVRRARKCAEANHIFHKDRKLFGDLATALEAQAAENAALRSALEPFALVAEHDIGESEHDKDVFQPMSRRIARAPGLSVGDLRRARATLTGAR